VGSTRALPVDVRIVSATHRKLEDDVRAGRFREDLYYRIAGMTLPVPPLRERPGDLLPVAARVLREVAAELGRPGARFGADVLPCLMSYPWPGNIRELRNEVARALALSDGDEIGAAALSARVRQGRIGRDAASIDAALPAPAAKGTLAERLDAIEAMVLRESLLRHKWNKTRAAQELGLSRVGLRAKLQRFGLEDKA
jgi:two-component system response regulator HupR/HoxA